jgi:2,4-diaminopentanoate dehydrogenase
MIVREYTDGRNKMDAIKILQVGLGPLGRQVLEFMEERRGVTVVGAVDWAPERLTGITGIPVSTTVGPMVKQCKPDAAVLMTVSRIKEIVPQIKEIVSYGIPVVSTCEELVYPWDSSPLSAKDVDEAAKTNNVAVVGTGVNPGFLMDTLPVSLTAVCRSVDKITVIRKQDASPRRLPFRQKIGAGLDIDEFQRRVQKGGFGHVGLRQSMDMTARRMGWKLAHYTETLEPVIATGTFHTDGLTVNKGEVAGIQQQAVGYVSGVERLRFIFHAAVGEPNPVDTVVIDGVPSFTSSISGGINGDIATCAIVLNAVKQIVAVSPGLKTMPDLPPISFFCQ